MRNAWLFALAERSSAVTRHASAIIIAIVVIPAVRRGTTRTSALHWLCMYREATAATGIQMIVQIFAVLTERRNRGTAQDRTRVTTARSKTVIEVATRAHAFSVYSGLSCAAKLLNEMLC